MEKEYTPEAIINLVTELANEIIKDLYLTKNYAMRSTWSMERGVNRLRDAIIGSLNG